MALPRIIQVEVTTACQAGCTFCPRTRLKSSWISRHMEWADFAAVLAAVGKGTLVHLQGWGEPLLHPRLWEMAAAVKQRKASVSLTTNGGLLDGPAINEICRIGFSFVAISLAGATPKVNEMLRPGPGIDAICANIDRLGRSKSRPPIHIDFQMMKPNMEHLPGVVALAARIGADRVIASNLDCICDPVTDALRAFGETRDAHAGEIIAAAKRTGEEKRIAVDVYPLLLEQEVPVCGADPLHTAVVTCIGEISPCVYVNLPLQGAIPRYFAGSRHDVLPFSYGRAGERWQDVMKGETANRFTGAFQRRSAAALMGNAREFALMAMPGLRSIGKSDIAGKSLPLPAAPEQCRYCYKRYGI